MAILRTTHLTTRLRPLRNNLLNAFYNGYYCKKRSMKNNIIVREDNIIVRYICSNRIKKEGTTNIQTQRITARI